MKLTMKTDYMPQVGDAPQETRREPRVGDVYTSPIGGHVRIVDVRPADEHNPTFVAFDDGSFGDWPFVRDEWPAGPLRLITTGAVTLAEREQLGIMPDIDDDSRTPLEKMTAERDEAVARLKGVREGWRDALEDLRGSTEYQHGYAAGRAESFTYEVAETKGDLDFVRAFAASQGRVIRELKAELEEERSERMNERARRSERFMASQHQLTVVRDSRKELVQIIAAEIGVLRTESPRGTATRAVWRMRGWKDRISTLEACNELLRVQCENGAAEIVEALDALRGMVAKHCQGWGLDGTMGPRADGAHQGTAIAVLEKYDLVEKWNGREAWWPSRVTGHGADHFYGDVTMARKGGE